MTIDEALELLHLPATATPELVESRYKQMAAFFGKEDHTPAELKPILDPLLLSLESAYEAVPHATSTDGVDEKKEPDKKAPVTQVGPDLFVVLKNLAFPYPLSDAGAALSDSWWKVYKRLVLLGLALIGLVLYNLPANMQWPSFETSPTPTPTPNPQPLIPTPPTPSPSPTPVPTPTPVPINPDPSPFGPPLDPNTSTSTSTSTTTGIWPNPNPVVPIIIAPQQAPDKYVFSIKAKMKDGEDPRAAGMIKEPPNFAVIALLNIKQDQTPQFANLPVDALQTVSQSTSYATIRVKERYFSGLNQINDYYLVAENGVWKLSDIQPAKLPDPGDPITFVYDHFAAISRRTYWQAYKNLDADMQKLLSQDSFKYQYQGWYVPRKDDLSKALTVESITPDASNPAEATIKLDPAYFTFEKVTTLTGEPANLIIDLVNDNGTWRIHGVRRVPVLSIGKFAPKFSGGQRWK